MDLAVVGEMVSGVRLLIVECGSCWVHKNLSSFLKLLVPKGIESRAGQKGQKKKSVLLLLLNSRKYVVPARDCFL